MKQWLCLFGAIGLLGGSACGPSARQTVDGFVPPIDAPKIPLDGTQVLESLVYAHTGNHLYRIDTVTNLPIDIGVITGLATNESVTDIAVDKAGKIVGIGFKNLYSINKDTGAATLLKTLPLSAQGFTSLSYVPTNLQDMNSAEILVAANNDGDVFSIDPATGDATPIGAYGVCGQNNVVCPNPAQNNGKTIGSSGDIVAVYGAGIYATVNIGTSNADRDEPDYLAKINPTNWKATLPNADTGLDHIFGLAFWKGKVYGFVDVPGVGTGAVRTGKFVSLDPNTGAATELKNGPEAWFGAGVTTIAPIVE